MYDPEILKGMQMLASTIDKHAGKLHSIKLKYVNVKNEAGELVQIVPELEIFMKG